MSGERDEKREAARVIVADSYQGYHVQDAKTIPDQAMSRERYSPQEVSKKHVDFEAPPENLRNEFFLVSQNVEGGKVRAAIPFRAQHNYTGDT